MKYNTCSSRPTFFFVTVLAFLLIDGVHAKTTLLKLPETYVEKWIDFYPSEAFTNGHSAAAWHFENFSKERVIDWIEYNRQIFERLTNHTIELSVDQAIDVRVLLRQTSLELERWHYDKVLANQAMYYAELISQALTYVIVRDQFSVEEKLKILIARLRGVQTLAELGLISLRNGSPQRTQRAIKILEQTIFFYSNHLPVLAAAWTTKTEDIEPYINETAATVKALVKHMKVTVLPVASIPDKFDNSDYERKLKIHTDSDLSPEKLKQSALNDITEVRRMMKKMAASWWKEQYPQNPIPTDEYYLLHAAIDAMENEREDNRKDFLNFFIKLTNAAEHFVVQHELATVPLPRTLKIDLSPDHFSGAAYGGVYPTGPFNPNADTLFYLPTIPDDSPEEMKEGFYRSFNTHFNTMIIAHEMLPGHYLQYKVGVSLAPTLRSLFANGIYVEGWGTFSEELMLNRGWGGENKLTKLAHLRKRLENATRAYVSVMVHHENWGEQKFLEFATKRGLLAPQFAINLWNRVMNNPLQITNYFLGLHQFKTLWREEKERLGSKFNTRDFVDSVLQAGPIPIDLLSTHSVDG